MIMENLAHDESVGTPMSSDIPKERTLVGVRKVCLSFGNEARPQNTTKSGGRTQGDNKIGVTGFPENRLLGQRLCHDNLTGLLPSGFRGSKIIGCATSGVAQRAMREAAPHARSVSKARQLQEDWLLSKPDKLFRVFSRVPFPLSPFSGKMTLSLDV
jgi:hypothetical protein